MHVSGLPKDATEGELQELFGRHGQVLGLQLLGGARGGQICAIIRYAQDSAAEAAVDSMNGQNGAGSDGPLVVKLAKPNPRWDK